MALLESINTNDTNEWAYYLSRVLKTADLPVVKSIDCPFSVQANRFQFGSIQLLYIKASPHSVTGAMSSSSENKNASAEVHVHYQISGSTEVLQDKRRVELLENSWSINSSNVLYVVDNWSPSEQLLLTLSWYDLYPDAPSVHRISNKLHLCDNNAASLLLDLMKSVVDASRSWSSIEEISIANSILILFKGSASNEMTSSQQLDSLQLTFERIKGLVARRLSDPNLNLDYIADAIGCSKRYLHNAFKTYGNGQTLNTFIIRRRLEQCRSDLTLLEHEMKSISEIAYSWGFEDVSHFSRVFKAQFGESPSKFRANVNRKRENIT